jgi:hypothetical protein
VSGHGSPPPSDRAGDSARSVTRDSGMIREEHDLSHLVGRPTPATISEYRPPVGVNMPVSDRGTRFAYSVGGNDMGSGQVGRKGSVRTLQRARAAVQTGAKRLGARQDLYSGKGY